MKSLRGRVSLAAPVAVLLSFLIAAQATAVTWSPRVRLTTSGTAFGHGLVTLDSSNAVLLYDAGPYVYVRRSTNSGMNWKPKQRISDDSGRGLFADIAGRMNDVDVVYEDEDSSTDTSTLSYRRSTNSGATFGTPVPLRTLAWDDGFDPAVGRGPGDVVAVAWHELPTNTIRVRVSTDGGVSFGPEQTLATVTGTWFHPPVVAVGDGVIYVAYHIDATRIRLRRSLDDGATWRSAVRLSNNGTESPTIDTMTATADGAKAYVGYTVTDGTSTWTRFRRTTNRGGSWSAQVDISPPSANPSLSPELALVGGTLHAAYEQCVAPSCKGSMAMYRSKTATTAFTTPEQASHPATEWASPAGVGRAGRVIVGYTADNGEDNPFEPNTDIFVRTGTP